MNLDVHRQVVLRHSHSTQLVPRLLRRDAQAQLVGRTDVLPRHRREDAARRHRLERAVGPELAGLHLRPAGRQRQQVVLLGRRRLVAQAVARRVVVRALLRHLLGPREGLAPHGHKPPRMVYGSVLPLWGRLWCLWVGVIDGS